MAAAYTDRLGRTEPGDRIAGPGCLYVGNLHRGRVVFSLSGQRMKVVSQNEGSTTVRITKPGTTFTRRDGSVGRIHSATEDLTIARGTIVRPMVEASHHKSGRVQDPRAGGEQPSSTAFARSGSHSEALADR